jgi:hypothetical protein
MESEYTYTNEELERAEALRPYENKWVALVDDKVVASGDSPEVVKEHAEEKGYPDFVYHLVPSFANEYLF